MKRIVTALLLALPAALPVATRAGEVPDLVIRLALDYPALPGADTAPGKAEDPIQAYAYQFFLGLTHPAKGTGGGAGFRQDAYGKGQAYWRDHPEERERILAGYGYTKVEAEGRWSRGFELSRFVPDGGEGETWWVSSFGGVRWTELGPGQADARFPVAHVHLTGYLSPAGKHGHLGQYTRELLATAFTIDAP